MLPFKKSRIARWEVKHKYELMQQKDKVEKRQEVLIDLGTAQCASVQRRDVKKNNSKTGGEAPGYSSDHVGQAVYQFYIKLCSRIRKCKLS